MARLSNAYLFIVFIDVGFCDAEITQFPLFSYFWPEVEIGTTASLPCGLGPMVPNGMARRTCNPETADWDPISLEECFISELIPFNLSLSIIK